MSEHGLYILVQELQQRVAVLERKASCSQIQIEAPKKHNEAYYDYLRTKNADLERQVEDLKEQVRLYDEDRKTERDRANNAWAERGAEKGRHHETECRLNDAQVEVNRLKTKVVRMAEVAITKGNLHDWLNPANVQLIIDIAKGTA